MILLQLKFKNNSQNMEKFRNSNNCFFLFKYVLLHFKTNNYVMTHSKQIKSALISVFDKTGLEPIVKALHQNNVTIYSTGGTEVFIKNLNIPVVAVEDITAFPEILGGRVKTLHPKIFGGIFNRQDNETDVATNDRIDIPQIDLVIVDLYPFEKTVASGASEADIIEKIDIGGISLIRAAAKNFKDTTVIVASVDEYATFLNLYTENNGSTSIEQRKLLATKAFTYLFELRYGHF